MDDQDDQYASTQQPDETILPAFEIEEGSWGYLKSYPCHNNCVKPVYFLKQPVVTFGRRPSCTHVIPSPQISGNHFTLEYHGIKHGRARIKIIDNGSSNGTWVNETKLVKERGRSRWITEGMVISLVSGIPLDPTQQASDFRFVLRDVSSPKSGVDEKWEVRKNELLGSGTFGKVYRAFSKSDERVFAVKHVDPKHTATSYWNDDGETVYPDQLKLQQEVDILTELVHENICRMHDYFWNQDKSLDIVLDYVDGGTLREIIPGLSERMTKHLMRQLCKALAHIHWRGVTHRDLKPENILLTAQLPPVLKLADFGLAKLGLNEGSMVNTAVGSYPYLAPELIQHTTQGMGYPPFTVDVWAAGLVMYECIAGRQWYQRWADSWQEAAHMDCAINWRTFDEHIVSNDNEGYPVYVSSQGRTFIRSLLQADPMKRPTMDRALRDAWIPPKTVNLYAIPTFTPPDDLIQPMRNMSFNAIPDSNVPRDGTSATPASTLVGAGADDDVVRRWDVDSSGLVQSRQTASPAVKRPRSLGPEEEEDMEMDMSPKKKPTRGRGGS
ncbi:kinase-like domain-containing protein [Roridomyces roridus]|uniref:Kinase-like domain-containing protein n=1 Tax=Roridomyces roridus TaxID=1738132 RepID=A0AAD7CE47_9AGAR|nr:kinase-like domain-containing protein [Roridomyces roridus]